MIVPHGPQLPKMARYVGKPLIYLFAYDIVVVVAFKVFHWEWIGLQHIPLALLGSAIGLLLGFRNNSAYGRWWEARTLWGAIVNNSRSFARQVSVNIRGDEERTAFSKRIVYYQIAYVHSLRQQLRGLDPAPEIAPFVNAEELEYLKGEKNAATALQGLMATRMLEAKDRGWIDSLQWSQMDGSLDDLADAQGGSERIKNTPMPRQYDYFPWLFTELYCLMLPLALVTNMGWYTPLGSTVVGFVFLSLNKIGRDLEDPFDNSIYDVSLTAICKTIEINLRQMVGEKVLPDPEKPIRGVLW